MIQRIAVILTKVEDWSLLRGTIRELAADPRIEVAVVISMRHPVEAGDPVWAAIRTAIEQLGVGLHEAEGTRIVDLDPDRVVTTVSDDTALAAHWKFEKIERRAELVVALPAPIGLGGEFETSRVQSDAVRRARIVLVRDERERTEVLDSAPPIRGRVLEVGRPELESAAIAAGDAVTRALGAPLGSGQRLLLWNPSHVLGEVKIGPYYHRGWSSFLASLPEMIAAVQADPDLVIACALHPLLRAVSMHQGLVDRVFWSRLDRLERETPNLHFVDVLALAPLAHAAHAVVTDPSAWLGALAAGCPRVCLVHDPLGLPLDREDPAVQCSVVAEDPTEVRRFVADAGIGEPTLPARARAARATLRAAMDRPAGREILDLLRDAASGEVVDAAPAADLARTGRALLPMDFFVLQNVTGAGFALYHFLDAHPEIFMPHRDDSDRALIDETESAFLARLAEQRDKFAHARRIGLITHARQHLREDMPGRVAAFTRRDGRLIQLVRDPREVLVATHRRIVLANVTSKVCEELGRPGVVGALDHHPTHADFYATHLPRMRFFAEGQRYAQHFGAWTILDAHDLWPENAAATMRSLFTSLEVDPSFESSIFQKDFHGEATKMLHFSQQVIGALGLDLLVRIERTCDVPYTHCGFHREIARVDDVSARLTQAFPAGPVSLVMTDHQFKSLPVRIQNVLGHERCLQPLFENEIVPAWIEQVNRIHAEVHAVWEREISPALLAQMHEDLDADYERFFARRPDLEEKWGWFSGVRQPA